MIWLKVQSFGQNQISMVCSICGTLTCIVRQRRGKRLLMYLVEREGVACAEVLKRKVLSDIHLETTAPTSNGRRESGMRTYARAAGRSKPVLTAWEGLAEFNTRSPVAFSVMWEGPLGHPAPCFSFK